MILIIIDESVTALLGFNDFPFLAYYFNLENVTIDFQWGDRFILINIVLNYGGCPLGSFSYKLGVGQLFGNPCRGVLLLVYLRQFPKVVIVFNVLLDLNIQLAQVGYGFVAVGCKARTPRAP